MSYKPFASDESLGDLLPGWMLEKGIEHWRSFMRASMRVVDNVMDSAFRARLAAMPGQVFSSDYAAGGPWPNVDALWRTGKDRGLIPGKHEEPHVYAARLRDWHAARRAAGTDPGLLYALRAVLAPTPPRVRVVRGGIPTSPGVATEGYWWTLDDDGLRYQTWDGQGVFWPADGSPAVPDATEAHPWDWDSQYWAGSPAPAPDPSRLWAIVLLPTSLEITAYEGEFGDGLSVYGEKTEAGDKFTTGTTATAAYVASVKSVLSSFKASGCIVSHVITTFDEDRFNPADAVGAEVQPFPDGWWKHHGKIIDDAGTLRRVRARSSGARYWLGTAQRWGTYFDASALE